jgi:hypothetical protein
MWQLLSIKIFEDKLVNPVFEAINPKSEYRAKHPERKKSETSPKPKCPNVSNKQRHGELNA